MVRNIYTRWLVLVCLLLALVSVFIAGCGRLGDAPDTVAQGASTGNTGGASSEVKMDLTQFAPVSITIKKGESIKFVNSSLVPHTIENGTWNNGTPNPVVETGAPKVKELLNSNDTKIVGPFTTAGTFQLYCTLHPGMNLTVTVQ